MDNVTSVVKDGQLLEITYILEDDHEMNIFEKLVKSTIPTCPNCGNPMVPQKDKYMMCINNPLQPFFGMNLGYPVVVCSTCGQTVKDTDDNVELEAFPSVVSYLTKLREEYKKRAKLAQKNRRKS